MRLLSALLCAAALAILPLPAAADNDIHEVTVDADFAQVKQDIADAIINRGLVIEHTAQIGDMLARTREAVGSDKTIYTTAENVQFCSAVLSRKMMEADARNIAFCPFIIFYYERAGASGVVHIGYRELDADDESDATEAALKQVNALLADIVAEVTSR